MKGELRGVALALFAFLLFHAQLASAAEVSPGLQATTLGQAAAEAPKKAEGLAKPKMEIYGRLHMSADGVNLQHDPGAGGTTPSPAGNVQLLSFQSNTSILGFRGSQDLGAVKALWQIESNINVTGQVGTKNLPGANTPLSNTLLSSRDTFVGLWTPYGTVKAGYFFSPYYYAVDKLDPLNHTVADMRSVIHNSGFGNTVEFAVRQTGAVAYLSPNFSGFELQLQYNNAEQTIDADNFVDPGAIANPAYATSQTVLRGTFSGAIKYQSGPLYAAVAGELHNAVVRGGDSQSEYALEAGIGYTFPTKTTVTAIYEYLGRGGPGDGGIRTRPLGAFVSVKQDFGNETFAGTFGYSGETKQTGGNDAGGFFGVAWYHHFGKSTDVYLAFADAFNSTNAESGLGNSGHGFTYNAYTGKGIQALSLGLIHRFNFGL